MLRSPANSPVGRTLAVDPWTVPALGARFAGAWHWAAVRTAAVGMVARTAVDHLPSLDWNVAAVDNYLVAFADDPALLLRLLSCSTALDDDSDGNLEEDFAQTVVVHVVG